MKLSIIFLLGFQIGSIPSFSQKKYFDSFLNQYFNYDTITRYGTFEKIEFKDKIEVNGNSIDCPNNYYYNKYSNALFYESVLFKDIKLDKIYSFSFSTFKSNFIIQNVRAKIDIDLDYSTIFGRTFLNYPEIEDMSYIETKFLGGIELGYMNPKAKISFIRCIFDKYSLFSNGSYNQISFSQSTFLDKVTFYGATFKSPPNFEGTNLPKYMNLIELNLDSLNGFVDFRQSSIDSLRKRNLEAKCVVELEGSDLSKILLPHNLFNLSFLKYTTYEMKTNTYERILKTCKDNGMVDSFKSWDIEFQCLKNVHEWGYYGGIILNYLNFYWWRFGHEKWRILFYWLPLFFGGFLLINIKNISKLYKSVYRDSELGEVFFKENLNKYFASDKPNFNNWKFRITYSIFYTASIYFGFKLKHNAINYRNFRGMMYIFLMYAVGSIHMAFALSYVLGIY
jgi:hypothetical protein